VPSLRLREIDPIVELSPDTAEAIGLDDGDWAFIETGQGRVRMKLRTNPDLHPRVACGSYGWWQGNQTLGLPPLDPFSDGGSNYNLLVDSKLADPITGVPAHRSTSCRVVPVKFRAGWAGFRPFRVRSIERVAEDVMTIAMSPLTGGSLPNFQPGQHLNVRWRPAGGQTVVRSYSLIGPALESDRTAYRIAIRRCPPPDDAPHLPEGLVSSDIHDRLKPGDCIDLREPGGTFVVPVESARPIVMVAGGIGITPFLSYLETIAAGGSRPRLHLVNVNRSRIAQAFGERIRELAAAISTLSVINLYTREGIAGADRRRPTADDILLKDFDKSPLVFFCGPNAMMNELRDALVRRGFDAGSIFREAFTADEDKNVVIPQGPFVITYARSGISATWTNSDGPLLSHAETRGLDLPSGCRVGQCESCAARVLSGTVIHRVKVNRPEDGCCLLCQAVPTSDLVLDA
jgi:ferredoxin-NADP reductase